MARDARTLAQTAALITKIVFMLSPFYCGRMRAASYGEHATTAPKDRSGERGERPGLFSPDRSRAASAQAPISIFQERTDRIKKERVGSRTKLAPLAPSIYAVTPNNRHKTRKPAGKARQTTGKGPILYSVKVLRGECGRVSHAEWPGKATRNHTETTPNDKRRFYSFTHSKQHTGRKRSGKAWRKARRKRRKGEGKRQGKQGERHGK